MNKIKIIFETAKEVFFIPLLCFLLGYMICVGMQNDMYKEIIKVCPIFHSK